MVGRADACFEISTGGDLPWGMILLFLAAWFVPLHAWPKRRLSTLVRTEGVRLGAKLRTLRELGDTAALWANRCIGSSRIKERTVIDLA